MPRKKNTILDSAALGTGLAELVRPCNSTLRPADPGRVAGGPTFALTFSGGGFRATLAALGVVRYLADIGRLSHIRFVSSVSGGSIANGMLATQWATLREEGFTTAALDEHVIDPVVDSISDSSMKLELIRNAWRALGRRNRTHVLARAMDHRFFHGRTLASLDPECRFVINAANIVTGVRFAFERDVIGDYVAGLAPPGDQLPVAFAVAASAAVPGAFAPLPVPDVAFPCPQSGTPLLLDGGTYDNTGLAAFDADRYADLFLIAMNAGGMFRTGRSGGVPFIRNLTRSNSLLYRQSTGLRTQWMVDRFKASEQAARAKLPAPSWGRQGVLMTLASQITGSAATRWRSSFPEERNWQGKDLAFVPTVFDRLDRALCRLLVYRGWWLTGATIAAYHPGLAPPPSSAPPLDAAGDDA
jgi:NTE family protein